MNIIKVTLANNTQRLAECSYLQLNSYSNTFFRQITFYNLHIDKNYDFIKITSEDVIKVRVNIRNSGGWVHKYVVFEIFVYDIKKTGESNLIVIGFINVKDNVYMRYEQMPLDILNSWQSGIGIEKWREGALEYKKAYCTACRLYSDGTKHAIEKSHYYFNLLNARDIYDIILVFAEEIYGNRVYMGWDERSFEDCLITILSQVKGVEFIIIVDRPNLSSESLNLVNTIIGMLISSKTPYQEISNLLS